MRDVLDVEEQEEEGRTTTPPNENSPMSDAETARDLLRMVLLNEHGRTHVSPPESEAQTLNPSPTPTEDDTPGYPFRPFLGDEEDDIPTNVRLRPYLAGQINRTQRGPTTRRNEKEPTPLLRRRATQRSPPRMDQWG